MGAEITGLSLPPSTTPNLFDLLGLKSRVASIMADVGDLEAVTQALRASRADVVLHLAAQALVRPSYKDPVGTFHTNVMGVVNILEAARRVGGVRATVIVTTDKCYENREQIWSYREGDPLGGRDPYSGSKAAAEIVASAFGHSFFGDAHSAVATARAGNVLGGGDWSEDRLVPDLIRALSSGIAAGIRRPSSVRPWQHVLEPLSGYLVLAQALATDPARNFESWNFGPDHEAERDVMHVATALCDLWGRPDALNILPTEGPHEAGLLTLDNTKARVQLGWRPKLNLSQALGWVVDWYKSVEGGADARDTTAAQIDAYVRL